MTTKPTRGVDVPGGQEGDIVMVCEHLHELEFFPHSTFKRGRFAPPAEASAHFFLACDACAALVDVKAVTFVKGFLFDGMLYVPAKMLHAEAIQ
jgi:hypothetical protein